MVMPLEPLFMAAVVPIEVASAISLAATAAGVAMWRELRRQGDQGRADAIAYVASVKDLTHVVASQTKTIESLTDELRKERA